MIGVCLTVIGLVRVVISIRSIDTVADDFLTVVAAVFLLSCLLSYWALRRRSATSTYRVERLADVVFLLGLLLMSAVCGYITYAIA
jgi:hypothetical protein